MAKNYKRALFLTLFGLIAMFIASESKEIIFSFELKNVLYIIAGMFFSAAFSIFTILYIQSKDAVIRKRKTASRNRR